MPVSVKVAGVWRKNNAFVKVAGAWKYVQNIHVKVAGVWKPTYSYSWAVGAFGACSVSCGGGTQTRSVVCTRNDGVTFNDGICTSLVGAKPATSQACNTHGCTSCNWNFTGGGDGGYYWEYLPSCGYSPIFWGAYLGNGSGLGPAYLGGCKYWASGGSIYSGYDSAYGCDYQAYQICRCCPNC